MSGELEQKVREIAYNTLCKTQPLRRIDIEAAIWAGIAADRAMEPTKEMIAAGSTAIENNIDSTQDSYERYEVYDVATLASESYRAMQAAKGKLS